MAGDSYRDAEFAKELFEEAQVVSERLDRSISECTEDFEAKRLLLEQVYDQSRFTRLLAREFVFSVDYFDRFLKEMASDPNFPVGIKPIYKEFKKKMPGVTPVRDSLHHQENRVLGLDKNQQRINMTEVDNYGIVAPAGSGIIGGVNQYGEIVFTMAGDGTVQEVKISDESLQLLISTLQRVIDVITWKNPNHFPRSRYPAL